MSRYWIYSDQGALFGQPDVVGYGGIDIAVRLVDRDSANDMIRRNHYSRKVYSASTLHFGVFSGGVMLGALQFGYAMNPQSMGAVVKDTKIDEYLELNRMWLCDSLPRNSESRALSYALKVVRVIRPRVGWVQSFADERCGALGVVYQACSFLYCGEHVAVFWELDGVVYHNSLMTRRPELSKSAARLQDGKDRAVFSELRQFRYIKFLRKGFRHNLRLPVLEYPKRDGHTEYVQQLAAAA